MCRAVNNAEKMLYARFFEMQGRLNMLVQNSESYTSLA